MKIIKQKNVRKIYVKFESIFVNMFQFVFKSNRKMKVALNSYSSRPFRTNAGVTLHHGSILDSILLLISINDLLDGISS